MAVAVEGMGAEVSVSVTLVSGASVALSSPALEGESIAQLRLRIADALAVPCGQVALLSGTDLLRDLQKVGQLPGAPGPCEVTAMVSRKWDEKLQDLLVDTYHFTAVGIASLTDGLFFASSRRGTELLREEDSMRQVTREDGTETKMLVREGSCILQAVQTGQAPEGGLWLAGKKMRIIRHDTDDLYPTLIAVSKEWTREGLGIVAMCTQSNLLVCRFDRRGEELYAILGQLRKAAASFADLLAAQGM